MKPGAENMHNGWRWALGAIVSIGLGLSLSPLLWNHWLGQSLGGWIFKASVEPRITAEIGDYYPDDGMLLGVCGAGGPIANPVRTGPCLFVRAGGKVFVVDAGNNAARNLALMQVPFSEVEMLLLTHFHSDHIDGLGELMLQRWIAGGWEQPLPVLGASGVAAVVSGFNRAYTLDQGYRTAHHGIGVAPPAGFGAQAQTIADMAAAQTQLVYEQDGLRITAFPVVHEPVVPALGYRFDYRGRSLVISGDTAISADLAAQAKGVDLLVHEALQPTMVAALGEVAAARKNATIAKIMADIPSYHTSPEAAAELAQQAGVGHLLLYHLIPPLPSSLLNRAFLGDANTHYDGSITLASDMTQVFLPAGSKEIRVSG